MVGISMVLSKEYYTCALDNNPPCPPPNWDVTYNLTLSTICQPGNGANTESYFIPPPDKPWGFISLDWSIAESIWQKPNRNDSTVEATSITGCQLIKNSSNPKTRCLIYHNMNTALQVIESNRAVMYDPSKKDWWLQYTDGKGNKNGTIYNSHLSTGGDQYFWDFRNKDAADYYISSIMKVVSDPACDGTYSDCIEGTHCNQNEKPMNLSQSDLDAINKAEGETNQRLIDTLIENGKYDWQAFGHSDGIGPGVTKSECQQFMNDNCKLLNDKSKNGNYTLQMEFDANNSIQSLAAFLIIRPKYGWLGYGWESDMRQWNDVFLYNVGEPKENICNIKDGIYSREWTYGQVTLDCNKWEGTVPHK